MAWVTYQVDDRLALMPLEAPDRGNAFNPEMRRELNEGLVRYRDGGARWCAGVGIPAG